MLLVCLRVSSPRGEAGQDACETFLLDTPARELPVHVKLFEQ